MKKLNLVGMAYEKDAVLNALQRTGAVEVKLHREEEHSAPLPPADGTLSAYHASLEDALERLTQAVNAYGKEHKGTARPEKDGFEVSYEEFMAAANDRSRMDGLIARVNALTDRKAEKRALLQKTERTLHAAAVYRTVEEPLSSYRGTAHTRVFFGTLPFNAWENILEKLPALAEGKELAKEDDEVLVLLVFHKSCSEEGEALLSGTGFTPCPFEGEETGSALYARLKGECEELAKELDSLEQETAELGGETRALKIYCDYIGYEAEKAALDEKLRGTERTFLLEAFVPEDAEELVRRELSSAGTVYLEFSEPAEDEEVPTLCKNNAVISDFESLTNTYSVPNAREMDPNTVMAVFYSVFMGFIMADIGYGLLMMLGGGWLKYKNRGRKGGLGALAGVFAIGGIFAVIWGFLFNSLFGITLPIPTVLPNAQSDMWTFAGIGIPAVLVIAMLLGIVQLLAGYVCKAVQCWRRGEILDGILDGVVWAVFSLGAGLAIAGLVEEWNIPILVTVGGITAGVTLVIAMIAAGRHEKFFGKLSKGFGTLYGIINYMSDILSYARLYGLMLSGAVIAQIVSQYAVGFITGGGVLAVLGILLMLVGHVFNLAIGLLGAYIHDARLQYVEFYGRFYEGEGELFVPLGSKHEHVFVKPYAAEKRESKSGAAAPARA